MTTSKNNKIDQTSLAEQVRNFAKREGAALIGFAPVERFNTLPVQCGPKPQDVYPAAKYVVAIAVQMPDACMERACVHDYGDPEGGFINVQVSLRLNHITAKISRILEKNGHTAFPVSATIVWRYRPYKQYPTPFLGDVSHRHMAVGAGLGEFGWNGLLLTKEYGPRVRLATVITDAVLESTPMYEGQPLCDRCMRCVRECGKNIQGLTKEVNGKVNLVIGGKECEYANKNLWRCAWTENFAIQYDAPKPDYINEESMKKVFRDIAANHPERWRTWTIEPCWGECLPKHLRVDDHDYCKVPRRIKDNLTKGMTKEALNEKISDKIKDIVKHRGLARSSIRIIDLGKTPVLLEKFKYYLPDMASLIVVKEEMPATFGHVSEYIWHQIISLELDLITYLDGLGFSALQMSFLRNRPEQELLAEIFSGLGFMTQIKEKKSLDKDIKKKIYEPILSGLSFVEGDYCRIGIIGSNAKLQDSAFEVREKTIELKKMPRDLLTREIKSFAIENGADLVGVTSVKRINSIVAQLKELLPDEYRFNVTDCNIGKGLFIPKVSRQKLVVKTPGDYMDDASSVIVIGMKLSNGIIDTNIKTPSEVIGPYAVHRTFSLDLLAEAALKIANQLIAMGYKACPINDLCGLASHFPFPIREYRIDTYASRFAAIAAGLGELGVHGMVLTPENGARQIFMSIVTDAKLKPDSLYTGPALCRQCFQCADSCPVSAIDKTNLIDIYINDRKYSFGKFKFGHCDWSKKLCLVGDEGPKFCGSQTNIKPPETITEESISEAVSQIDEIQKDYFLVMEPCIIACPAHKKDNF